MASEMLPLPLDFVDRVAFDKDTNTLFAELKLTGDPRLLTWRSKNEAAGRKITIKPTFIDEIPKLRDKGFRIEQQDDVDMFVKADAVEIIRSGALYGASDIHFMDRGDYTEIQFVVKGELRVFAHKKAGEGAPLMRAIYQGIAKTRERSYNPLEFQNAQIPGDALPAEFGVSSCRIVRGSCYPQEKNASFMTIRMQFSRHRVKPTEALPRLPLPRKPEGTFDLGKKGYSPEQVEKLKKIIDAPNGIVFVTGPTGSGKTQTLFELLAESARTKPHRRLVTIEDPVENVMDWAVQMVVTGTKNDAENGEAFLERGRVALRMAPHNILIGELRGKEVAVSAFEAALTGHMVFTTMHVTDPYSFVERLELMDRERLNRKVFCDHKNVRAVIAQRLLMELCPHCSTLLLNNLAALEYRIVEALETWGNLEKVRIKGEGCAHCGFDGVIGRFAVAEIVLTDANLMRDFIEHGTDVARENYRKTPGADKSMLETAIGHILNGRVDPRNAEEAIDYIEARPAKELYLVDSAPKVVAQVVAV